jgi:magnesium-transporting ATPase (P-type)
MFKVSGLILLLMLIGLNILSVQIFFQSVPIIPHLKRNKYFIVIVCFAIILPVLYFRYFQVTNYDEVKDRLYSSSHRKLYVTLGLIYIGLSLIFSLGYIIVAALLKGRGILE